MAETAIAAVPVADAVEAAGAQFAALLVHIWHDLHQPAVLWQIGALALCLILGWYGRGLFLRRVPGGETPPTSAARRFGEASLRRLSFPLLSLLLVLLARVLLERFHNVSLLDLAVPLLMSLAAIRLAGYALREVFGRRLWVVSFERWFGVLVWLAVALHVVGWLPEVIDALESVSFSIGTQTLNLWMLLQGAAMVLLSVMLALWAGGVVDRRIYASPGMDLNLRVALSRVVKALLVLVAFLIALPMVGIDLTTLSVFGGAFGVGLGMGMQKIAANYVSGFILLLERSLRIGNLIAVGGERGVVKEINTRYTVLRAANGVESIIPNDTLVASVVQNETFSDSQVSIALNFQVAYSTDLERALEILVETALAQPRVVQQPKPSAFVLGFGDNGIDLRLSFWIADPQEGTLGTSSAINLAVWRRFRELGIEFPYPQREVRLLPPAPGTESGADTAARASAALAPTQTT